MGDIRITGCDHCGKRVENPYAERGWLQIAARGIEAVSISRSVGRMGPTSYETDYLRSVRDFCGIACLIAALDQKAREREDESLKITK